MGLKGRDDRKTSPNRAGKQSLHGFTPPNARSYEKAAHAGSHDKSIVPVLYVVHEIQSPTFNVQRSNLFNFDGVPSA